eukprot:7516459-Heterocapsa_arctica.AAC.1
MGNNDFKGVQTGCKGAISRAPQHYRTVPRQYLSNTSAVPRQYLARTSPVPHSTSPVPHSTQGPP